MNVGGGVTSAETAGMGGVVAPMAAADGTAAVSYTHLTKARA